MREFSINFPAQKNLPLKKFLGISSRVPLFFAAMPYSVYVRLFVFIWCKPNEDLRIGIFSCTFFFFSFSAKLVLLCRQFLLGTEQTVASS